MLSSFRHRGINVIHVDDQLTPTEEFSNLITLINNSITENEYIEVDDCVHTYDIDINDSTNIFMPTLNEVEIGEEKDEIQDKGAL